MIAPAAPALTAHAPAPFDARLAKLRAAMQAAGADVYLCDHAEMLHWLTGYSVSETFYRGCVIPAQGAPVWVLRAIDEQPCRAATWVPRVETYADHQDAHAAVAARIAGFGPARVAADFHSFGFTAHTFARLRDLLPGVDWVDMTHSSGLLRSVKDAAELSLLGRAAVIGDGAMASIAAGLRPGMRPRDASAIAAFHYLSDGADDYWVGPISISRRAGAGDDMGFLHAGLKDEPLQAGDVLHAELVPRVANYSTRFMRSIKLGTPDPEERQVMKRLRTLQDAQFAAMVPGARARDVDAILRDALLSEGLRKRFDNICGYQTGIYTKTPRSSDTSLCLHPMAEWRFEAGQVFHIYATARGLALSETVVVEPDGARPLNNTARDILQAGAR